MVCVFKVVVANTEMNLSQWKLLLCVKLSYSSNKCVWTWVWSPWLVPGKENSEHALDKSCSKIDVIFQDPEEWRKEVKGPATACQKSLIGWMFQPFNGNKGKNVLCHKRVVKIFSLEKSPATFRKSILLAYKLPTSSELETQNEKGCPLEARQMDFTL